MSKHIVLVGHCGPDSFMLKRTVENAGEGFRVSQINDESELREALDDADLLLVNRVLDGSFRSDRGIELIEELAGSGPAMMLVSNYEDAQESAERAGAAPGFGKRDAGDTLATERIRAALGLGEDSG